jgi:hypothetical protein
VKCWYRDQYAGQDAPWIQGDIEINTVDGEVFVRKCAEPIRFYNPTINTAGPMLSLGGYRRVSDRQFIAVGYDIMFTEPKEVV